MPSMAPSAARRGSFSDWGCDVAVPSMSSAAVSAFGLSPLSRQMLYTMPALRGLGEAEREHAAGFFRETSLTKGETIYHAGDEADALYLVVSGAVDVVDGMRSVARYGPGEVFGEAVLVPGERRAVTTRVALDAVLVFLPKPSLARLLELHPSLHERVAALLGRRLKEAVRIVGDGARRPSEIVVLQGWTSGGERRAFVEALAGAIEGELGREVSIVTVAPSNATSAITVRGDRPDGIVAAAARDGGSLRDRLATELATRAAQAPVVLLELDGDLGGPAPALSLLADTVLVRIDGRPPAHWDTDSRRVAFVQDERSQTRAAVSANKIISLSTDAAGRACALGRLARYLTRRSVGVALGSGAAWGFSHIGVLEVLDRERIPVDVIAGASMGAIVGAHYALGFSPARMTEMATGVNHVLDFVRILPQLLYLAVDFNIARPGLFAGDHFQRVLESLGPIKGFTFADLEIPFRAVATDIGTGARVEIGDGDLSDAVRASFSAPWIFSPFRIGEHVLVDGGMSDPVPAETVRSMGADLVIGVNVVPPVYPSAQSPLEALLRLFARANPIETQDDARLPNSFDVVVRILQIMQHELGNNRAGEADILVNPDLRAFWVLEFWNAAGMIEQGRRAAEAALPTIRAKLDELRKEVP
jgi:NTE family protein